jgi:lipase
MTMEHHVSAGLAYAEWKPTGEPAFTVLALHGLTSTSQVWTALAGALPQARVIAPDLPGRVGSLDYPAEPGLAGHADAVLRLADELDLTDTVVVGHSMGAFLTPLVAAQLGPRAKAAILLDGGIAPQRSLLIKRPIVRALFTLQMRMIDRPWPSHATFVDKTEGRAIRNRPDLRPALLEWADYELHGPPGNLRPKMDTKRMIADAINTLTGDATLPALATTTIPVHALLAAHGADDDKSAFISDTALSLGRQQLPRLTAERVEANHLTLLFDPAVPAAISKLAS